MDNGADRRGAHFRALGLIEAPLDLVVVEGFVPIRFRLVVYGAVTLFGDGLRRKKFDLGFFIVRGRQIAVFELYGFWLRFRLFFLACSARLSSTVLKPCSMPSSLSSTRVGRAIVAARRKSSKLPPMLWAIS